MSHREQAYLSLGANLGEPLENLRQGAAALQQSLGVSLRLSAPWITTPVDCPPDSPPFANAAAAFPVPDGLSPEALLAACQEIERSFGRTRKRVHNEARPLDLDIIGYGSKIRESPTLVLPHPRATERYFVLAPLAEIAPEWIIPGQPHPVADLKARCQPDPRAQRLAEFDW